MTSRLPRLALAAALAIPVLASRTAAGADFTVADVSGDLALVTSIGAGDFAGPWLLGRVHADGAGGLTGVRTFLGLANPVESQEQQLAGTYTVTADGRITMSVTGTPSIEWWVDGGSLVAYRATLTTHEAPCTVPFTEEGPETWRLVLSEGGRRLEGFLEKQLHCEQEAGPFVVPAYDTTQVLAVTLTSQAPCGGSASGSSTFGTGVGQQGRGRGNGR